MALFGCALYQNNKIVEGRARIYREAPPRPTARNVRVLKPGEDFIYTIKLIKEDPEDGFEPGLYELRCTYTVHAGSVTAKELGLTALVMKWTYLVQVEK